MDLPLLFFQSRIFRTSGLTPDLKVPCVRYVHLVSAKITLFFKVQIILIYQYSADMLY
jgi:hypothetical protein